MQMPNTEALCRRSGHPFSIMKEWILSRIPTVERLPQSCWRTKNKHFVKREISSPKHLPTLLVQTDYTSAGGQTVAGFDPVLISLIRRAMPNLVAYDLAGVQPMSGPTGLIFAMRSRYSTQGGTEALFDEADTAFAGRSATGQQHRIHQRCCWYGYHRSAWF